MSTLEEAKRLLKEGPGIDFDKRNDVEALEKTLTQQFSKVVLPVWLSFVIMEGGVISTLLGVMYILNDPWVLLAGGLVQLVPSSIYLYRKARNGRGEKK